MKPQTNLDIAEWFDKSIGSRLTTITSVSKVIFHSSVDNLWKSGSMLREG